MLKDDASGAVKIFRQTSATGTEDSPPCEPYSTRHNRTFIVTQNTAMKINVIREIMQSSRRWKIDGLADAQLSWIQSRIGREQRVKVYARFARYGGKRLADCNNMHARFGHRRIRG